MRVHFRGAFKAASSAALRHHPNRSLSSLAGNLSRRDHEIAYSIPRIKYKEQRAGKIVVVGLGAPDHDCHRLPIQRKFGRHFDCRAEIAVQLAINQRQRVAGLECSAAVRLEDQVNRNGPQLGNRQRGDPFPLETRVLGMRGTVRERNDRQDSNTELD